MPDEQKKKDHWEQCSNQLETNTKKNNGNTASNASPLLQNLYNVFLSKFLLCLHVCWSVPTIWCYSNMINSLI